MKKFISVLLSILSGLFLFCFLICFNIKNNFNFSDLIDSVSKSNNYVTKKTSSGFFYPEDKIIIQAQYSPDLDLYGIISQQLKDQDIEVDDVFVKEIFEDTDVKNILNDFFDDYLAFATGESSDFKIDEMKIKKTVNKIIDKYEDYYDTNIDRESFVQEFDEVLPQVLTEIEEEVKEGAVELRDENTEFLKLYRFFTGNTLWIIFVVLIIISILLIAIISKSLKTTLFGTGIPAIVVGLLVILAGIAILSLKGFVLNMFIDYINQNLIIMIDSLATNAGKYLRIEGIITFAIGILITTTAFFVKGRIDSKTEVTVA